MQQKVHAHYVNCVQLLLTVLNSLLTPVRNSRQMHLFIALHQHSGAYFDIISHSPKYQVSGSLTDNYSHIFTLFLVFPGLDNITSLCCFLVNFTKSICVQIGYNIIKTDFHVGSVQGRSGLRLSALSGFISPWHRNPFCCFIH